MKALQLLADWAPKSTYPLTEMERETGKVRSGSMVWKNPSIKIGTPYSLLPTS